MRHSSPCPSAPCRGRRWRPPRSLLITLALPILLSFPASAKDSHPLAAFAPVTVILEGLAEPTFLAIDAREVVYISDTKAGRVLKLTPDGHVEKILEGLKAPQGIAVDATGTLYVAAEELNGTTPKGLVLRRAGGSTEILASGFKHPTGLAVDETGTVYVAAEEDEKGPKDTTKGSVFRIDATGTVARIATGFEHPHGLLVTPEGELLVTAERLRGQGDAHGGTVFRVTLATGVLTPLVGPGYEHPHSLALDRLGALFFSAEEQHAKGVEDETGRGKAEDGAGGVISKRSPDGTLATFAARLKEPTGLAFDHRGNLYVVEAERGRLLRFQAPDPPRLDPLPRFTNLPSLALNGTAEQEALITVLGSSQATTVMADSAGRFTTPVALTPNALNTLQAFATGAHGQGLVSPPTVATIVHDAVPPSVRLLSPTDGTTVSGVFTVAVEATDVLAGVEGVTLLVDGRLLGVTNVAPYRFSLEAKEFTGGPHTLTIRVTDRAGNLTSTSSTFVVVTLRIAISSPADGSSVGPGSLLVRGTVEAAGAEVGVVVNGVPAAVQGATFAALVPVMPDTTTLTAVATTATGMTASHSVAITVGGTPTAAVALLASPPSGLAPLSVTFSLVSSSAGIIAFDSDGDGTVDFAGASLEGQNFTYAQPGLYFPTATFTNAQGNQVNSTGLVQVYDTASLNALLQARWTALKNALRQRDISQALRQIFGRSRPRYEAIFQALVSDLVTVDTILTDLQLLEVRRSEAIYEMVRSDRGVIRSFEIRFRLDDDGIWRLWMF